MDLWDREGEQEDNELQGDEKEKDRGLSRGPEILQRSILVYLFHKLIFLRSRVVWADGFCASVCGLELLPIISVFYFSLSLFSVSVSVAYLPNCV